MPNNFVADSLKKLCSKLSSSEVRFYPENGRFAFLSPPLGGLGASLATYDDHLRLNWKACSGHGRLIELFFARCYG